MVAILTRWNMTPEHQYQLAERVREECIQAALTAYENASVSGLCGEGAFEAAVSAMRMMKIKDIVSAGSAENGPGRDR